ncbi:MAG: hypothetical protein ONB46_13705 [candidate division KSB1 bacterium]|nr:hypothetical protein [candidate division KSB1 bacterium]MDZ7404940.1 hypothetical protein [candidate division KSB1 bacterium]
MEEKYASGIALTRLQVLVRSLKNVVTAKVKIKTHHDYAAIVPVAIPDLNEVRKFAAKLHAKGKAWKGEAFGWQAEYNPQSSAPPLDSKMTFTPADFCIGENGIWFFSLMWEHGSDAAPAEFLDDRGILKKTTRLIGLRFVGASMEAASTSNAGRTYCRNSVMN